MLYTTFMIFLYNLLYSYVICHELFRYICSMYPVFKLYVIQKRLHKHKVYITLPHVSIVIIMESTCHCVQPGFRATQA